MAKDGIRMEVGKLLREFCGVPDMKICDYFSTGVGEIQSHQQATLEKFGEMTLHEFMLWVGDDNEGEGRLANAFPNLAEIVRTPLNHFNALYRFYDAVMFFE